MENHSRVKAKNIVSKVLCFMKVKFERFQYEIDVETKHRGRMTQRTGPDWRPSQLCWGRVAVICTVIEDVKSMAALAEAAELRATVHFNS